MKHLIESGASSMELETGIEEYQEKSVGCHDGEKAKDEMAEDSRLDRGELGMPGLGIGRVFDFDVNNERPGPVRTIKHDGVDVDYGEQGYRVEAQTKVAKRILMRHLPEAMEHFLQRNAEYGEEAHVLGIKGQYADINRKVIKLKRYLWDDVPVPPGAESIEMISQELIGHLLILIDELDKERQES